MSLKKGENKRAIDRAVGACDREHKGAFEWQDCVQGVNIMRRLVRRKIDIESAEKAAKTVCLAKDPHPGPRSRCQGGVRKLASELRRTR